MGELEESVRQFVSKMGSKYKGQHRVLENFRAKVFSKKEELIFEVPSLYLIKDLKNFKKTADPKERAEQEEISHLTDKDRRTPKPFTEKSTRAQYAATKQVRYTYEAPAILLAVAQSQRLAGKKMPVFLLGKLAQRLV